MAHDFQGFSAGFFAFFEELAANNRREWFEANKPRSAQLLDDVEDGYRAARPLMKFLSKALGAAF